MADKNTSKKEVGEFPSAPVAGTALYSGVTFARKGLQYADLDGLAVFEGDIVLGTVEEMEATTEPTPPGVAAGIGITGAQFRWPNATIPYVIDSTLPNQQRVTDAIAHWQANTRIRFVQRTNEPNWVRFVPGSGCSSFVGNRNQGAQNITLGSGCSTGNAIHEIGHAVGLWHEQSREDRDTFVQIIWANIDPAAQHNFNQHITDGDDLGAYDFGSIMHYPPKAFSINGQDTIVARVPLPAGVTMGQRNGLSAGDIAAVHTMYPAGPTVTIKEVRKDINSEVVTTIKEARKDPITDAGTIKEVRKDPIQDPTIKELRKDPIQDPTIKEVGKDPATDPFTLAETVIQPGPLVGRLGDAQPFVMGAPSRAGGAEQELAEAAAQVEELAAAMIALEQHRSQLVAAYAAAVQLLDALQGGQ